MKRLLGILAMVVILYGTVLLSNPHARSLENQQNIAQRMGFFGVLTLGAGVLILSGGIDLSIGSVVGLGAVALALLLERHLSPVLAVGLVLLLGPAIGLAHGLLVTKLRLQPFIVTLCGLFIYRGAAREVMKDRIPQIAETVAPISDFCRGSILYVPVYLWLLLALFAVATVFLHLTIYGRYFYAIGSNERAAAYSGIHTNFYKILAYVLCSTFAAIYALMHIVHYNSVEPPKTGETLELYAIAGAVLGGCSLRGGEGTTLGILIGTAIMRLLPNVTNMWEIRSELEPTVIGGALLICVVLDEWLRRGMQWRDILDHVWRRHFWKYVVAVAVLGTIGAAYQLMKSWGAENLIE